jgi:ABC-type antimicrobial peptide transport system permease subunit
MIRHPPSLLDFKLGLRMLRLDRFKDEDIRTWSAFASGILLVSAIVLMLSMASIYAVMSFAASRRMKESAVRIALGARTRDIVFTVFRGPLGQVAAGIVSGCLIVGALIAMALRESAPGIEAIATQFTMLLGYGALMTAVCALACIVPVLRVLRVELVDVLKED